MRYNPLRAMEAINAAFLRMPKDQVRRLLEHHLSLSQKHGMSMYTSGGKPKMIDVQLRPWVYDDAQRKFFHHATRLIRSAMAQVMPLYLEDAKVRQIVPLEHEEHEWLLYANQNGVQRPQAVLDRLDSTATFACSDWRENFWFLEPNSVGIGGVHYIPATSALSGEWVYPMLKKELPGLRLKFQDDVRRLLLKLMIRHCRAIGRKLKRVAFIEDQSVFEGTDEFSSVAKAFTKWGVHAFTGDPRNIQVRRGELTVEGKPVDMMYRDTEITELFEMVGSRQHKKLMGLREAFRRNQVISSIAGEFDHKSAWELFTNPEFDKHFTFSQKRLFKKHVLWTRLIFPRKTTTRQGKRVDLYAYARKNRESLVIKPNRAYGGEGVLFGHQTSQRIWESHLERAFRRPGHHVVQQSAQVRAELFPAAASDGKVTLEPYFSVTGFAATRDGLAVLGRSSKESVVNVSRKGGLIAIFRQG